VVELDHGQWSIRFFTHVGRRQSWRRPRVPVLKADRQSSCSPLSIGSARRVAGLYHISIGSFSIGLFSCCSGGCVAPNHWRGTACISSKDACCRQAAWRTSECLSVLVLPVELAAVAGRHIQAANLFQVTSLPLSNQRDVATRLLPNRAQS
jgi:hypothetical protein